MKRNFNKNGIIVGALCAALIVPTFAYGEGEQLISTRDIEIIPISRILDHWSKPYIDQLTANYNIESVFKDKNPDSGVAAEDFLNLVRTILDKEYNSVPAIMTREAVVHELTSVWAEKTGQKLDEIAVIKMIIYSDTGDIDSKYNHSITVAYMKNIAKGRGDRVFSPKAIVTYGELATLLNNTVKAIENELKADGGIVKGTFQTRGNYEIKDNKVLFNFELMSHYTKEKNLQFGSGQQFEVVITDEKGEEVYRFSDGKFFTLAIILKTINPGEALKWQDEWNMTNKKGEKLSSGKYKAKITILAAIEDEKIEERELTTVIDFVLGADTGK